MCCFFSLLSSVVHLEVDNRQCFQQSSECFQNTDDAAAFLGALASSEKLDVPYKIEAVFSEYTLRGSNWIKNRAYAHAFSNCSALRRLVICFYFSKYHQQ